MAPPRTTSPLPAAADPVLHDEAVKLYGQLDAAEFCRFSTIFQNPPTIEDRLGIAVAIRGLGNSDMLHYLAPTGVTVARLYYLVALLEGVVLPHLVPLVVLCEQRGLVGPGKKPAQEAHHAKSKLAVAFRFLTGAGAPIFVEAPKLAAELTWAHSEKLAHLRNSIAHHRFRLEEASVPASQIPSVEALGPFADLGLHAFERLAKVMKLADFDSKKVESYEDSYLQYEEDLEKPLLPTSRKRTYPELRQILERVDSLGLSLLLAFMAAAVAHQRNGTIAFGVCVSCRQGNVSGLPGSSVPCPLCGHVGCVLGRSPTPLSSTTN